MTASPPPRIHTPLISIVIPMYNVEKFVETCIDSILIQTFQEFEVIIIDDCSTDLSLQIVREKYSNNPKIKIYRQLKNSGESAARNLGLQISQGKYVYFMDSDDAILPNTLEIFYNAIEKSNADVVHMNSRFHTTDNFVMNSKIKIEKKVDSNPTPRFLSDDLATRLKNEFISLNLNVVPWTKISRREFLIESGLYFPLTPRSNDLLQLFGELCFARKIQIIDACCYIRRVHQDSLMESSAEKHLRLALKSLPIAIEFIHEVFSSPKIISKISQHEQNIFEANIIASFFTTFIVQAYRGKLTAEQINKILHEVLYHPNMMNPEIIRVLINLLSFMYLR